MLKYVLDRLAAVPLCGWFAAPPELAELVAREAAVARVKPVADHAPVRGAAVIDGEVRCAGASPRNLFGLSPMR